MIYISASALERVRACPASAVLPGHGSTNPAAMRGTVIHAFLEQWHSVGFEAALAAVPSDLQSVCAAIDLEAIPTHATPEVAFKYDVNTGRASILGQGLGRDYGPLEPWEIPGTPDLYAIGDSAAFVGDYKTGRKVTPADRNPQLKFYALCAARANGLDACAAEIIRIDPETGSVWRDCAFYDVLTLDAFANELSEVYEAALVQEQARQPRVIEGPQCDYCPAFLSCPAKTTLIRGLATGEIPQAAEQAIVTQEQASAALRLHMALKRVLTRTERALRAYVEHDGPIPIGDGNVWGPVITPGNERIDGNVAHAVLTDLYGAKVADSAVTHVASKASIERALKAHADEIGKIAPARRKAIAAIRDRNGASRKPSKRFEIYPEGK